MASLVRSRSLIAVSQACFVALSLVAAVLLPSPARSQTTDDAPTPQATAPVDGKPRFVDLRVGFDRSYKVGCWTPVRIAVSSGLPKDSAAVTGVLRLETVDGDDVPSVYTSDPFQLAGGKPTSVVMYVRFGNSTPSLTLTLLVDGQGVLKETVNCQEGLRPNFVPALGAEERLVLCVGRSSTLDEVAAKSGVENLTQARISDVAELPTRSYGYDGVDAVLLTTDDVNRYSSFTPDGPQVAALLDWLQSGGKVTVIAGSDARLVFASAAWQKLAPITVGEPVPLPRSVALEEYAGGNNPVPAADAADRLRVLRSTDKNDVSEIQEGNLPLVVRRAVGLGVLTVSFVDLEHPQLRNWAGRAPLLARAMRLGPIKSEGGQVNSMPSYRSYGYGDLSGQLRSALDQYEGVAVVSFFVLALMILLYIALIGPFDYLLVRNVFKRTEMTWFTFPVIVVVTSAAAYYAARWMKGDELRVSQVDIVDCDVATGTVRGTTFAGIFSPKSDTYDLKVEPPQKLLASKLTPDRSITTWLGLSGNGFGGMHTRSGGAASWLTTQYEVAPDLESLSDVPIQVWSSKMFYARWQAHAEFEKPGLRAADDGSLSGTLWSPLQVPLERGLLCYGTKAYPITRIEALKPYDVAKINAKELSTELHHAEVIKAAKAHANPGVRTRPHDPGSQDVDTIVRKMMFFDAAGGRSHANLDNDYHNHLDLSELLKLNRAVLVGFVDSSPDDGAKLNLTSGGSPVPRASDRRWVFVRVVIPVEKSAEAQ